MWMLSRDHLCLPCKIWTKEIKTMNKVEKTLVALAVVGMVGFGFAISVLKGIPEAFDWEEEDE